MKISPRFDFKFHVLSAELEESEKDPLVAQLVNEISFSLSYNGRMIDISGGGCAFNSSVCIPLNASIKADFTFRGQHFEFETLILDRKSLVGTGAAWDYRYRAKFINISERVVDNLTKLVLDEQRDCLINNGTLNSRRFV